MEEKFEYSLSHIDEAAEWLLDMIKKTGSSVVAFYGNMGAGKTTLISELSKLIGVEDVPSSPTFAIVNVYKAGDGSYINHFDFYRTQKVEEAYDIGFEEYLDSDDLCLIEWPQIVEEFLPSDVLKIYIEQIKDNSRKLTVCIDDKQN